MGAEIHISETTSAEESLKCLELWRNSITLYYVSKLGCVNRNIIAVLLTYRALQFNISKLCNKKTFFSERGWGRKKALLDQLLFLSEPLNTPCFLSLHFGEG